MKALQKGISSLLVLSILGFLFPGTSFCSEASLFAKAKNKTITQHEAQIRSAPEKEITMVTPQKIKKQGSMKYIWMGLGAAALVGLMAAVAGGGGGAAETIHTILGNLTRAMPAQAGKPDSRY